MKFASVLVQELESPLILTPERYTARSARGDASLSVALGDIALIGRETVSPSRSHENGYAVADTGDAEEGVLKLYRPVVERVGSTKKRLQPGDVIISRLRPYLRQVALVDADIFLSGAAVVCSTEFYVLRSLTSESIAFLVPWLLSQPVQAELADSQEGAHHPRFSDSALMRLRVPQKLVESRVEISIDVERAVENYRSSRRILSVALSDVEAMLAS